MLRAILSHPARLGRQDACRTGSPPVTAEERTAIRRLQLLAMGRQLPVAALGNIIGAGAVAAMLYSAAVAGALAGWLAAVAVLALFRLLLFRRIRSVEPDCPAEVVDRLRLWAIVLSGMAGALWGLFGVAVVWGAGADMQSFVDCVIVAVAAAAVATSLAIPAAAQAFILLAVLPPGLAYGLVATDRIDAALAVLSVIYAGLLIILLKGAHASVVEALLERLRNERLAQELAEAVRNAKAASEAKSQFLATISHEIRTPLNAVIGLTELLLHTRLTPVQREYAATARQSGDALLGLVSNVLDLLKIEAGRVEIEAVPFELGRLIEEVAAPFRDTAFDRGLSIVTLLPSAVPRHLVGDPYRLRQVLINLLDNAVKFTERGRIALRVAAEDVHDDSLLLAFTIEDTGPGIDADKQACIFEAFVQGDGSTTRRHGGSGLGLAICRELCELMGGSISVSSTPGQGAVFRFTARVRRASAAAPPPLAEPAEQAPITARVLLVEDNPANLLVASGMLQRIGCEVETATSGREALDRFLPGRFAMVFMDWRMPDMDGFATTAAMREREPAFGRRTPIVALTANAVEGDRARCLAAGMDDYLAKPLRLADLHRIVARWAVGTPAH